MSCLYFAVAVEHAPAANRMMNDFNGDSGDSFSIPLSLTGAAPALWYGGTCPESVLAPGWVNVFANFETVPYVPRNGYPLADGTTEADCLAAQAMIKVYTACDQELTQAQLESKSQEMMRVALGAKEIPAEY